MPVRLQSNLNRNNRTAVSRDWEMNPTCSYQCVAVFLWRGNDLVAGEQKKRIYIQEQCPTLHARGQHSASLKLLVVCVSAESSQLVDSSKSEMLRHKKRKKKEKRNRFRVASRVIRKRFNWKIELKWTFGTSKVGHVTHTHAVELP